MDDSPLDPFSYKESYWDYWENLDGISGFDGSNNQYQFLKWLSCGYVGECLRSTPKYSRAMGYHVGLSPSNSSGKH